MLQQRLDSPLKKRAAPHVAEKDSWPTLHAYAVLCMHGPGPCHDLHCIYCNIVPMRHCSRSANLYVISTDLPLDHRALAQTCDATTSPVKGSWYGRPLNNRAPINKSSCTASGRTSGKSSNRRCNTEARASCNTLTNAHECMNEFMSEAGPGYMLTLHQVESPQLSYIGIPKQTDLSKWLTS